MIKKTHELLDQLEKIAQTFDPPWLKPRLAGLHALMAQVYDPTGGNR